MAVKTQRPENRRVGTVTLSRQYVVDLDDEDMVQQAKECIYEDLVQLLVKNPGLEDFYEAFDVKPDETLTEDDIDDYLAESAEERIDDPA